MNVISPRPPQLHPNVAEVRARTAADECTHQPHRSDSRKQIEPANVGVQRNQAWCGRGCPCRCHDTRRSQTPAILSRLLGQLFVDYSSIPVVTPECNHQACKQTSVPKIQAEFWFPANIFWSKIIQLQVKYQAATGPSLQLRTYRHVADSAPAINYTIKGNIDALKALFAQGLASPTDISDTRGYSLLRVSSIVSIPPHSA